MKYLSWILNVISLVVIVLMANYCHCQDMPVNDEPRDAKKDSIEIKIVEKEKEVIKWKQAKERIKYDTIFDTLATKEQVFVELIKCDSVVKISDSIIVAQDTIIADQKEVIAIVESDNSKLKRDLKKQKRKNTITKIVAVVVIVGSILLSR